MAKALTTKEHRLIDALARKTRYTIKVLDTGNQEYSLTLGFYSCCLDFIVKMHEGTIIGLYEIMSMPIRHLAKIESITNLIGTAQDGDFNL